MKEQYKKTTKVKAIIERGDDGSYGVYLENDELSFGLMGEGNTVAEAIDDFLTARNEMKAYYKEVGKEFPELEFVYKYDTASFLEYYSKIISLAGLERLTGVNQGQLSHYLTGRRKPSAKTTEKIQLHLHEFGKELQHLEFA